MLAQIPGISSPWRLNVSSYYVIITVWPIKDDRETVSLPFLYPFCIFISFPLLTLFAFLSLLFVRPIVNPPPLPTYLLLLHINTFVSPQFFRSSVIFVPLSPYILSTAFVSKLAYCISNRRSTPHIPAMAHWGFFPRAKRTGYSLYTDN